MGAATDPGHDPSFLRSELAVILQLSSPVLLVVSLMFLIGNKTDLVTSLTFPFVSCVHHDHVV